MPLTTDIEKLTAAELMDYLDSDEFRTRCAALNKRIDDEPMTFEWMAAQLGLPFEIFAAFVAQEIRRQDPNVTINFDDSPKAN